jgi:GNAT superfamily N-acetyltransferase
MITLQEIAVQARSEFAGMTFPLFRPALENSHPAAIAVGARVHGRAAALGLAVQRDADRAELLSLYVKPSFRQRGFGTELLRAVEIAAKERGCAQLDAIYTSDSRRSDLIGGFLSKNGWSEPKPRMLVCRAGKKILEAPWIERYRLPSDFQIASWSDVTPEEREDLRRRRDRIPATLFPLDWEQEHYPLEPLNSILIRQHGSLIGWLLTHRVAPDTIRYTCAFVSADLQRQAIGLGLMIAGIERQLAVLGPESYGIWATPFRYAAMSAFIQRRMKPWLDELRISSETRITLTANDAAVPVNG